MLFFFLKKKKASCRGGGGLNCNCKTRISLKSTMTLLHCSMCGTHDKAHKWFQRMEYSRPCRPRWDAKVWWMHVKDAFDIKRVFHGADLQSESLFMKEVRWCSRQFLLDNHVLMVHWIRLQTTTLILAEQETTLNRRFVPNLDIKNDDELILHSFRFRTATVISARADILQKRWFDHNNEKMNSIKSPTDIVSCQVLVKKRKYTHHVPKSDRKPRTKKVK